MVEFIGEFSKLSALKARFERRFPDLYERLWIIPMAHINARGNDAGVRKRLSQGYELENLVIETTNRCNSTVCMFCPANPRFDKRKPQVMTMDLFKNIVADTKEYGLNGTISMECNNEPLLDPLFFERIKYIRKELPDNKIGTYTNGILMTPDKAALLFESLTTLDVDNYTDDMSLTKGTQICLDYVEQHPDYSHKLRIRITRPFVKRNNRAGLSPNRKPIHLKDICLIPWTQMVINPNGLVSNCCNDVFTDVVLGNVNEETIESIWQGVTYDNFRRRMFYGRHNVPRCTNCDYHNFSHDIVNKLKFIVGGNYE